MKWLNTAQEFSEDTLVVSAKYSKEEALELFGHVLDDWNYKNIFTTGDIKEDYCRYRLAGEGDGWEGDDRAYFLGARKGRGAQRVWVLRDWKQEEMEV